MIRVPNIDSIDSILLKSSWRQLEVPRHLFHFSPSTLEKVINEAGLTIKEKNFLFFPRRLGELESYFRYLYSTFKLIYLNLTREKVLKQKLLLFPVTLYKFAEYLQKKWCLRILKKMNLEERSGILYICVKSNPQKYCWWNVSDLMGLRKKIICYNFDLKSPQKWI